MQVNCGVFFHQILIMKNVISIFLILIINITPAQVSTLHIPVNLPTVEICKEETKVISHQEILEFIIRQEGFHKVCKDEGTQFTNGYGTKAKYKGEVIDRQEALKRLKIYYLKKLKYTKKTYPNLTQSQARVVTAIFFNLGSASKKPNLHKSLTTKSLPSIKKQLITCIGNNPRYKKGLAGRRKREIKLLEKIWNFS